MLAVNGNGNISNQWVHWQEMIMLAVNRCMFATCKVWKCKDLKRNAALSHEV